MADGSTSAGIANGASLSGSVDLTGLLFAGLYVPSAWTAAAITFQASHDFDDDDTNAFVDVYNTSGTEYTIASANVVANRYIAIDPRDFAGARFIKIRSGTSSAAVNQAAARTIVLGILAD